jgi:hypothetical protein
MSNLSQLGNSVFIEIIFRENVCHEKVLNDKISGKSGKTEFMKNSSKKIDKWKNT